MKSITLKLVLAFLGVSLVSIALIVFLAQWTTDREFRNFIVNENQASAGSGFATYYAEHGSWVGVTNNSPFPGPQNPVGMPQDEPPPVTLVDNSGLVVLAGPGYSLGSPVPQAEIDNGEPITLDGTKIGTLIWSRAYLRMNSGSSMFLERTKQIFLWGALGAAGLALILAAALSRSLTRPIRELTIATRKISAGNLEHEVPVRSHDELGELTASFNRMNAELARSLNLRRQMTADIAHELRTPLSIILGHAEAVHEKVLPPSLENFEIIRDEASRLEHLVEDLRTLSRADAGELRLEKLPVAPSKMLADVYTNHRHNAKQKNISLEVSASADLPLVNVDASRIIQVLSNLLDNALRYTLPGGSVTISARQLENILEIKVQDSGIGIAEAELGRVFDRFYRSDPSRQRKDGGSGLGLAIAKSLVEKHNGRIWAESKPGEGTTMIIHLPITEK